MRTTSLALLIGTAVALAGAAPATATRLAYSIERLGNAQSATLCEPGAAGTAHAVALEHTLGSWARFNWPQFEPVAGTNQVEFQARAATAEPTGLVCRVLTEDGLEWQSRRIALTPEWQEVRLVATDFTCFRGATPESAGALDLARAMQFQVLPMSQAREGTGCLQVDEVRFLPGGPAWRAEGDELRTPREADVIEHERLRDLLGRWQAEAERLAAATDRTRRWSTDLEGLIAAWEDPGRRAGTQQQLGSRRWAWQEAAPTCSGAAAAPALSLEDYRGQLRSLDVAPVPLLDLSQALRLSAERLYSAPPQEAPAAVVIDGRSVVRHRLTFTAEATRQTVFTRIPLPGPADLAGQRLVVRMRCSPVRLNETYPFLLRLYTDAGGAESWADLRPSPMPGNEWQDVTFDTANPARQARANPGATLSLALRFENVPGTAADFVVELGDVRRAPPEPGAVVRRQLLAGMAERLTAARDRLAAERDRVAALEDRLRDHTDLRRLYLASFGQRRETADEQPGAAVADPLAGLALPARPLGRQRFGTTTALENGQTVIRVTATGLPDGVELRAALLAPDGGLVAAGRGPLGALVLRPGAAPRWAPGLPFLYRLRLAALAGDRVVAWDERPLGLRTCTVVPGGPTPLLRHARQRRQPDWTFLLNGACWFPRLTVYHWPEPARSEAAGARLLGDLWLDGTRSYGFGVGGATWERYDRLGLAMLTGVAPSYRALASWDDVVGWSTEYARACRQTRPDADRSLQIVAQVGNEVELSSWGADLAGAFPDALYHPLDLAADVLRREWEPAVPVMYVRAGTFREVPPLPHEQVCGVNQYTGRYSGRSDEIERDLAELARYALWADRPLMITEWMGPKYSWATGGVGGVSPRGAAWYLERYWRGMIGTPGVVGSSEFTLNWVIAPFEDLTNQTREEAWRNRPPHAPFGGGHTADHVPVVAPADADRQGPCFRAMQAFQSPLYIMAENLAPITVWGDGAERLVEALAAAGVPVRAAPAGAPPDPAQTDSHLVLLRPAQAATAWPPGFAEPGFRTALNPNAPDLLLTTLDAADAETRDRGLARLVDSANGLAELRASEGAMTRALVVADPSYARAYSHYVLEFAGRGYFHSGDDVRNELTAAEFFDAEDRRRPAWQDVSTVILDVTRVLTPDEVALATRLCREGANLILSAPCYAASPLLRDLIEAEVIERGTLADHVSLVAAARTPLPVADLGGADLERIRRFRPELADSKGMALYVLRSTTATALATAESGEPIVLHRRLDKGNVFLVGAHLGAAATIHSRVTHAGQTHPIYDRDTACGLERLSRVIVNLGRFGCAETRQRPRLRLLAVPERTIVPAGGTLLGTIALTDAAGQPVTGQVRVRARVVHGGRPAESGPYVDLLPRAPGCFDLQCPVRPAGARAAEPPTALGCSLPAQASAPVIASVQIKAYAPGFVPADGALAYVIETARRDSAP